MLSDAVSNTFLDPQPAMSRRRQPRTAGLQSRMEKCHELLTN